MKPCLAGWATVAEPAAHAEPPRPASLENRPRRTPLSTACVTPPATPASPARSPKAPERICPRAASAWAGWVRMMTATSAR